MSDTPVAEQAAERESLKTRNWVLGAALGLVFLFVQMLLTYNINSAMSKADKFSDGLEKVNQALTEVLTTQKVQQVESRADRERITTLETKYDRLEQRVITAERRQAITDAFNSVHKYDK